MSTSTILGIPLADLAAISDVSIEKLRKVLSFPPDENYIPLRRVVQALVSSWDAQEAMLTIKAPNGDTLQCYGSNLDMATLSYVVKSYSEKSRQLTPQEVSDLARNWETSRVTRTHGDGTQAVYHEFLAARLNHFVQAVIRTSSTQEVSGERTE